MRLAGQPRNLGARLGEELGSSRPASLSVLAVFSANQGTALPAGTGPLRRMAEDRTGLDREVAVNEWFLYQAFNAEWVDAIQPSTKLRNALACNSNSSASVAVAIVAPV